MRSVAVRFSLARYAVLAAMLMIARPAGADEVLYGVPVKNDFWSPMRFSMAANPFGGPTVWAAGAIKPSSATEFVAFLSAHAAEIRPGTLIVLNSPGGDPEQGMAIGQLIRDHLLWTLVGQRATTAGYFPGVVEPGICASACSLAFLGGVRRSMPDGSVYGVHDASITGSVANPYAEGQADAAAEAAYMTAMGVAPELAVLKNKYDSSKDQLLVMSTAQMAAFNVTTRDVQTSWDVEQVDNAFALVGASPTRLPKQSDELLFWCDRQPTPQALLGVSYVPDDRPDRVPQTRADFIKAIEGYRLERTGATPLDFEPDELRQPPVPSGAVHVTAYFKLTPRVLDFLTAADEVRFEFVVNGSFFNRQVFETDVASGRNKITRFLASCR